MGLLFELGLQGHVTQNSLGPCWGWGSKTTEQITLQLKTILDESSCVHSILSYLKNAWIWIFAAEYWQKNWGDVMQKVTQILACDKFWSILVKVIFFLLFFPKHEVCWANTEQSHQWSVLYWHV